MASVLVVDDDVSIRALLAMVVEDVGHSAVQAVNGRQALEITAQRKPDLVLADVMMPEINGATLCRGIKLGTDTARIPVILMSAATTNLGEGAGADAFVAKPFDIEEIERMLERCLPKHSTSRR